MKYARLSLTDLKDLEKEFIEFLVVNGIPANEWEALKKTDMSKVEAIIDQFSDVVWESILRKHSTVEKRFKNQLVVCRVSENTLSTWYIQPKTNTFDLTQKEDVIRLFNELDMHDIRKQTDKINKSAAEQLFDLIKLGFYLVLEEDYKMLK
ncbi:MAG: hypothetical protein H3C31_05085 [Brumimicrobium sp.]|nr:hypothetical protein [Brumimicrobium sp.]MCO5269821.1 DUF6495 family protein [Brumimicrobium sp.]